MTTILLAKKATLGSIGIHFVFIFTVHNMKNMFYSYHLHLKVEKHDTVTIGKPEKWILLVSSTCFPRHLFSNQYWTKTTKK